MGDSLTGQVSEDAAKIYETFYLPALFQEWCPRALAAADVVSGHRLIDIACETGALAIAASEDALSDEQLKLLLETAEEELTNFKTAQGKVVFTTSAHIVTAKK